MQHRDTTTTVIHFICGFAFGFLAVLGIWLGMVGENLMVGVIASAVSGVIIGIIAAVFLDQFWESLKNSSWWRPF